MSKYSVGKSDDEWKSELSEEEYRVLREKGTEMPHSGQYNMHFEEGKYYCQGCGNLLFDSEAKFESNCGWPSFDRAVEGSIEYIKDNSLGMMRIETLCANCGGHLGHVFNDGPTETGERFCINSASMNFNDDKS